MANNNGRFLDLVLSNQQCVVDKSEDYLLTEGLPTSSLPLNFRKVDFHNLYEQLCLVNWDILEDVTDVNIICSLFYNKLNSILAS